MTITVQGTLLSPLSEPVKGQAFRITSLSNTGSLLGVPAYVSTNETGSYNFNLVEGEYRIEHLNAKEGVFHHSGSVKVESDSTGSYSLEELLLTFNYPDPYITDTGSGYELMLATLSA